MSSDPRIDAYIAKQADFARPILTWVRERFHAALPELVEDVKWSHPFFTYKGKPLANMAAFKAHAAFGFWDHAGVMEGKEREAMGSFGRVESMADLPPAAELEALILKAAARIDAGVKPPRAVKTPKPEAEVPAELAEALAADDVAKANFTNFPPGCRREYCEWIGEAKRPETRAKRAAEAVSWISEGKRRNWKYENC